MSELMEMPTKRLGSFDDEEFQPYRALSKAAVLSATFAVLGIFAVWIPFFVLLPLLAVCFGAVGYFNIKRYPDELVGKQVALFGAAAGAVLLVSSIAIHAYVYSTEVPEGYTRISFSELKPNSRNKQALFTQRAEELDGQQIFLKGYVRPGDKKTDLSTFVLTGDFGDCCFGGSPKINEVVGVKILTDKTVDYGYRLRKVIGTFRLNRTPKNSAEKDVPRIVYEIEAMEVL